MMIIDKLEAFDREITLFFNGSHSLLVDNVIYIATSTWAWVLIGALMLWVVYKDTGTKNLLSVIVFLALCITVSDQFCSSLVKPLFHRLRPANDSLYMYMVDVVNNYRGGRYSFFSAHASNTFTVAVFFGRLFKFKPLKWLLVSWALLNCYTRIYLGVHYFGDILIGIGFGLLWGNLMYWIYYKKFSPALYSSSTSLRTRSGYRKSSVQMLCDGILLNYCLIFIVALF